MAGNILTNPIPLRLEINQDKALDILSSKGFNRSLFIRAAIDEKLYKDFRVILKKLEPKEKLPFE